MSYLVVFKENAGSSSTTQSQQIIANNFLVFVGGSMLRKLGPVIKLTQGSSPSRVTPKTLKMVLIAFSPGAQHMRMEWEG